MHRIPKHRKPNRVLSVAIGIAGLIAFPFIVVAIAIGLIITKSEL